MEELKVGQRVLIISANNDEARMARITHIQCFKGKFAMWKSIALLRTYHLEPIEGKPALVRYIVSETGILPA